MATLFCAVRDVGGLVIVACVLHYGWRAASTAWQEFITERDDERTR